VIGSWSAIPVFFIVLGGVVISFPWASNLIYRIAGDEPPVQTRPPEPPKRRAGEPLNLTGLDAGWARAEQHVSGWQSITLRLPASNRAPLAFTIDQAHRGRPDKRALLTLNKSTGEVVRFEDFSSYNRGRQIRTWLRWIHTGEAGGVVGQTIAGVVSAGGAVLVWTGLALSWRRFRAWRVRRRSREEALAA
jgi:uncharacterized iron-regulated membrane protein